MTRVASKEDACSSPVTLGPFHDFLRKLDQCFNEIEQCLKNSPQGLKCGQNHRDGLGLSREDDPDKSKSKSQDGAMAHPSSSHSLGEEPLTSKKLKYDASSTSKVSSFCLPSQSIWCVHPM